MTDDLTQIAADYAAGTAFFSDCIAQITPENIDTHYPGEWSARQCVHHMADAEAQSYARLRRLLAEPNPVIQGYDEAAWAESPILGYADLPIENSVAVLMSVRAASHDLLRRISTEDLDRTGTHTASGEYSLRKWIMLYSKHPYEHGDQLLRALRGEK